MRSDDGRYQVVWPKGKRQIAAAPLARRLGSLAGKRVAQLWDNLFRGDEMFLHLEQGLRERFPGIGFVSWREFGNTHGGDEREVVANLPSKLKEFAIDAVISGVGACGSCTPAVIRASAAAERAGVPAASLISEGFVQQAKTTVVGLGLPALPIVTIPGHPGAQSHDQLRDNTLGTILDQVVTSLTQTPASAAATLPAEPLPRDIVFTGSFREVNEHFYRQQWSDGLPIVPPNKERVEEFLRFTDLDPDTVLGVLLPDNRAATVWNVAVNGVMAGCRPEYMPVLVAVVEVLCDPDYGVEHSGNTPGADALIILNGPIIKRLGFNYQQGVLRDGFQANTSIGRFLRLYTRNVCGFLLHKTDKACYGNTWRVVMPENEDVLKAIDWQPLSAELGFNTGDNTVTLARYTGGDVMISATGDTPEMLLPYLADGAARMVSWQLCFTVGATATGMLRPLMVLSPIIAQTIAKSGWSKQDVKQYLFDHARIPAWKFENYIKTWTETTPFSLKELVRTGDAPRLFHESPDPERLLPIVCDPEDFLIAVSGDPLRTNVYYFQHNGSLGYPTAKKIKLPERWDHLLASASGTGLFDGSSDSMR